MNQIPPGKRRFYQNVLDAYRLTKRSYPALPWMLLGTAAAVIAIFMLVAWLTNMSWIGWLLVGIMGAFTAALALLSLLARRALYSQVGGDRWSRQGCAVTDSARLGHPRAAHRLHPRAGPRLAHRGPRRCCPHFRGPLIARAPASAGRVEASCEGHA